ncbi:hypothetical protein [Derxia lacustris]|uniref:hypothetical protein n=1 Tax=Derxia lacustris TaxID=764842 RepID=UPI00111C4EFE|nr:hypothetical protein [Derxia lacustris]
MSKWRREFINRFPEFRHAAQEANYAGALMQRPLFFVLRDAIDRGDTVAVDNVMSYVQWLKANPSVTCATEIEEDLLVPILASNRLRAGFLQQLTSEHFAQIKNHCVEAWRSDDERNAKLQALELEFKALQREKKPRAE